MCERCTIFKSAFGLQVHCLQESLPRTWIQQTFKSAKIDKTSLEDEHDTEADYSGSFSATNSAPQQLGPTPPGTWYSPTVTAKERKFTGSNATFAVVPTYNPNTLLNWSDMVAFGSEAIQPPATTKGLEADVPYSILVTIMKNEDILDALMLNCPDFPTPFALVASCKTAKCAFERLSQGIIKAMLRKMSQELRYLTVALIGINRYQIANSRSIKTLMETGLSLEPKPLRSP